MNILAAKPEDDIVLTKWAGLSGTYTIVQERWESLKNRYSGDFLQETQNYQKYCNYDKEYEVLKRVTHHALVEASYGGVFGALFLLGYDSGLGVMADLEKIALKQQTIEVCEYYKLNPYLLHSEGMMVIATPHGQKLVRQLEQEGIPATVVGTVTQEKGRIVYLGEECRYLTPPRTDALFKCLTDASFRKRFPKKIVEK